jgi:hypothetical protein
MKILNQIIGLISLVLTCSTIHAQTFYYNTITSSTSSTTIGSVMTGTSAIGSVSPSPGAPAGFTRLTSTFATGSLPGCSAIGTVFKTTTNSQLHLIATGSGAYVKVYSVNSPTSGTGNYQSFITNYTDKNVRLNSSLTYTLKTSIQSTGTRKTLTYQLVAGTTYYVTSYSPQILGGSVTGLYTNSVSSVVLPP